MIERITQLGRSFDEAYALLDAEFGARGELERRSVIEGWLRRGPAERDGLSLDHHLLVVRGEDGRIAALRDCHTVLDPAGRVTLLYLAHVLVLPAHRRRGLAAQLREAPIASARALLPDSDLLVVGEMEHPSDEPASRVRLIAYGRAGFRAVHPRALPYFQPDFRDPDDITLPVPVPLLLIVQHAGHDDHRLDKRLAHAVVRQLYAVFASHCAPHHLAPLAEGMHAAIDAWPEPTLPLLPLPRDAGDDGAFEALVRP